MININSRGDNKITLERINTDEAARNFSKLLNKNKTYFLNGKWGSGKTEFLKRVQELDKNHKYITIDFWRIKDDRSAITIGFSKLKCVCYWFTWIIAIILVAVSLSTTRLINLPLLLELSGWWKLVLLIFTIIGVSFQFFNIKSDSYYSFILGKSKFKNKVLIIDDFDRISPERQEEIYKLFNVLQGKLTIVFVGDYANIARSNESYIHKIIDKRIGLPFDLHPSKIWSDYFENLSRVVNGRISDKFKELVVQDGRNLRDRSHFNDYVNHEFFDRNKLGRVQHNQQLFIIYVYLFYPSYYQNLVDGLEQKNREENATKEVLKLINNELRASPNDMLKYSEYNAPYLYFFSEKKNNYLINEDVSNLSIEEFDAIINSFDDQKLIEYNYHLDFNEYFIKGYSSFDIDTKNKLLKVVINSVSTVPYDEISLYVIEQTTNNFNIGVSPYDIENMRNNEYKRTFENWEVIFAEYNFDFSQLTHLLIKYHVIDFEYLISILSNAYEIDIFDEKYQNYVKKEIILLIYIYYNKLQDKFDKWTDELWNQIDKLDDQQYLYFWQLLKVISNGYNLKCYEIVPKDKKYTIFLTSYRTIFVESKNEYAIKKINDRLERLRNSGYTFEEVHEPKYG